MHETCVPLFAFCLDHTQDLWFSPVFVVCRRFIFLLLPLPLCQGHHLLEVTGSSLLFLTFNLLFPLSAKPILPLTPSFLLSLFSVTHMHPPPDPVSSNLYIKPEDLHAAGKKKIFSFVPSWKHLISPMLLWSHPFNTRWVGADLHQCTLTFMWAKYLFFSFPSRCIFVCGVFVRHRMVVNPFLFFVSLHASLDLWHNRPKYDIRHKHYILKIWKNIGNNYCKCRRVWAISFSVSAWKGKSSLNL